MHDDDPLVDAIYEAAIVPELWRTVLAQIALRVGAQVGVFLMRDTAGVRFIGDDRGSVLMEEFIDEGWLADDYVAPLLRDLYPGFRAETAYRTEQEIEESAVHRGYFAPRGLVAGAATIIQGAKDDLLHLTFEGFPSHSAAEAALPLLDRLRPHLARAMSMTSRLQKRQEADLVEHLALVGTPAAVIDRGRRLRAASVSFEKRIAPMAALVNRRFGFHDVFLQRQLENALKDPTADPAVHSIASRTEPGQPPFVMHLLPLRGRARALTASDGVVAFIATEANASLPNADVLRMLFDLSPAEAKLARRLVAGDTIEQSADALGVRPSTARTQLRSVFAKTGVDRQSGLILLLSGLGLGEAESGFSPLER